MQDLPLQQQEAEHPASNFSYINELFDKAEDILRQHRLEHPNLYRIIEIQKVVQSAKIENESIAVPTVAVQVEKKPSILKPLESIYFKQTTQNLLKRKILENQKRIREDIVATGSLIDPRTKAHNRKQPHDNVEAMIADRENKLAEQIRAWRSILPVLIKRFLKIKDPRRAKSVKHKLVVILLYGLFAFIFRLSSRRKMNRELSGIVIFENLKKIFPEVETIPHADTVARVLERINVNEIEKSHIELINQLIRKKKFKKMLISGCLPIALDGTQKLYRDGELHDLRWLHRKVGRNETESYQQYVYVLEANIVFSNGLTVPLLTEYLKTDWNVLNNPEGKQECELIAFERLTTKLKKYFPRLRIMIFGDALFATQPVLERLHNNHWEYVIKFSKDKLKEFGKILNSKRKEEKSIPGQSFYREREQKFYWYNNVIWGYDWQLKIHLVSCIEQWKEVDKKTGEIITKYSQHQWVSSICININNVHELCNLGARKIGLIEDSIHTEKHRGYHYEHAFSYDWNAMQGFHLLMRLAHAVNAISEFTKKLKQWIKEQGCGAILKLIKETIFNPWLPKEWYEQQHKKHTQLKLQLE